MKRHLFASVIIGTLALSAGEAKAATITIDSFDDGFQHISAASSTTFNSTIYLSRGFGGVVRPTL
ncbi:hypothetical protein [Coleofasciculus sp. E1-EBD-02]|uniref:hypothetical protein n=1 Tax=Coleofasciculus sp. E1-EBD-02 TaxID=3068481 RepID=UPI0032F14856